MGGIRNIIRLGVCLLLLQVSVVALDQPRPPRWPSKYSVSWSFSIPYIDALQNETFKYKYFAVQDYDDGLQKVIRDDVETVIINGNTKKMYQIFPRVDALQCLVMKADKESGPTRKLAMDPQLGMELSVDGIPPQEYLGFILPDLTETRWKYKGKNEIDSVVFHTWRWDLTEESMKMHYTFFTRVDDGSPYRLKMHGINLYTGGHNDVYIADYYDFKAIKETLPDDTFQPPADLTCQKDTNEISLQKLLMAMGPYHQHAPSQYYGHDSYDFFSHSHGRRHESLDEYLTRAQKFEGSLKYISRLRAEGKTFNVGLNKFADWHDDEYHFLLGKHSNGIGLDKESRVRMEELVKAPGFLPDELSWQGSAADSPVKDQAACGSCWSFSAIAALESAIVRCGKDQTLLSEQSLLDCAWSEKNTGCFGGEQAEAFKWIFERGGGIAPVNDYPYRGINDFCHRDSIHKIQGSYKVVEGNEDAVKAALLTKGPLAVSVDADDPSFRFYTNGIYSNPKCQNTTGNLSHAVILSGWGTDPTTGKKFWLVKNTWSTWWGEHGYIRIERNPNDCGISAEAIYTEVECASLP